MKVRIAGPDDALVVEPAEGFLVPSNQRPSDVVIPVANDRGEAGRDAVKPVGDVRVSGAVLIAKAKLAGVRETHSDRISSVCIPVSREGGGTADWTEWER